MSLIDVTSSRLYTLELWKFTRLVVLREINSDSSVVLWANSSTITDINDVNVVVHSHNKVGATARFAILHLLSGLVLGEHFVDVIVITQLTTLHNGLVHVQREVWLHDNLVVKVLLQILSALVATVAIVNCEYLDFGPLLIGDFRQFGGWLDNVENDSNTIFIGFPYETNMCVGCEWPYNSEPFIACFRVLKYSQLRGLPNLELMTDVCRYFVIYRFYVRFLLSILRRHCWFIVGLVASTCS